MDSACTPRGSLVLFRSECSSAEVENTGRPVLGLRMARGRKGDGTEIIHFQWTHGLKSSQPVYTDAYLYKKEIFEEVERFREAIFDKIIDRAGDMPAQWELVLDLGDEEDPDERICHYYLVNCSNRSLFWLHEFDVTPFLCGLKEGKTKQRISESEFPASLVVFIGDPRP